MLGQILKDLLMLTQENSWLYKCLEALSEDISAQGGVVLNGLGFILEAQVRVVDSMLLFCCDPSYIPVTGWVKTTQVMEEYYSPTARKMVASYYQAHCAWYEEGKPVAAGKCWLLSRMPRSGMGEAGWTGAGTRLRLLLPRLRISPRLGLGTSCLWMINVCPWH